MKRSNKWFLILGIVLVGIAICYFAFERAMEWTGRNELYAVAAEKNYCTTKQCDEGIQIATEILVKESGLSADIVPWCMATNRIYFTNLSLLNPLKNKFVDLMYSRCERGELTLDDANISIGEPHSHDDDHDENNHE